MYGVLSMAYYAYLSASTGIEFYPDYVTNLVARQIAAILNSIGYEALVLPHPNEASMKLIIETKYVARIIEGCNAISVIILFVSFIIAFTGPLKATFFYCFVGSIILYAFNLIRIVLFSVSLYHFPWRQEILHNVIFPMAIYGTVFLLWMLWVSRFEKVTKIDD